MFLGVRPHKPDDTPLHEPSGPQQLEDDMAAEIDTGDEGSMALTGAQIADRILAMRPITWSTPGDLAQLPWTTHIPGKVLVLDLWSGCGGLLLSLLTLGITVYAVSSETSPMARQVLRSAYGSHVIFLWTQQVRAAHWRFGFVHGQVGDTNVLWEGVRFAGVVVTRWGLRSGVTPPSPIRQGPS